MLHAKNGINFINHQFSERLTIQQKKGLWGETLAADFISEKGLTILHRNWRYKRAEIDLIAKDGSTLVFVEVKVRDSISFGRPEEMVTRFKQRLLIDAAMAYMRSIHFEWEIRFDIIAITGNPDRKYEILHIKDAFFPGLDYKG